MNRNNKWGALVILAMATFIIVIDTTIMNVSISALVEDLNTTVTGVQMAISIYALVMASFMLIGGKLADILGKKRTFIVGLIIFGIGTTTASFSQSLTMLIIGWSVLEGIGSALMMPNMQTILRSEYDGADRARAYGVISAVAAIGAALGPIVGGFLTTYASWRWAFRLEVVIVIIVLAQQHYISQDVLPDKRPTLDILGMLFSILGWSSIVLGILLGQTYGFWLAQQPFVIGPFEIAPFGLSIVPFLIGTGLLLLLLLLYWEKQHESRGTDGLFKPSLFKLEGLTTAFFVRFVHMAIMAAFLFIIPLLFQLSFAYTPIETGLALMPYSLGVLIFALVGARLSARYTAKRLIQVGYLLGIAGLIILTATIQPGISATDIPPGILFGAGMGLVASQILNLILSSGSAQDTAEISGLNGTFEQLGNSIGVALVGTLMLSSLIAGLQQNIQANPDIPQEAKPEIITAVEQTTALVSDAQLQNALNAAGVTGAGQQLLSDIYTTERIRAFRSGMVFLIFLALAGLITTLGLSSRKLVEESVPQPQVA